jgi:hypothetical protein
MRVPAEKLEALSEAGGRSPRLTAKQKAVLQAIKNKEKYPGLHVNHQGSVSHQTGVGHQRTTNAVLRLIELGLVTVEDRVHEPGIKHYHHSGRRRGMTHIKRSVPSSTTLIGLEVTESKTDQRVCLLEFSYKDFLGGVDWSFINMRKHYEEARKRGVRYVPYDEGSPRSGSNGQYVFFKTPLSPRSKGRGYRQDAWYQTIRMLDFAEAIAEKDIPLRQQVNLMVSGDLQVHCTCPAFNWWGYRYIVTQLGAALYPQNIRPDVRNPREQGIICKHLASVMRVLPFWMPDITRDLRLQGFEPQEEPENEESPEAAR